ncbi:MAG: site-2 protease family protein [Bryobacteraceae bacterium]|nr:site-2 protease family protein [Bryobacteraceae bacterium]
MSALATTTWAGAAFAWGFNQNLPLAIDYFVPGLSPQFPILAGLPYSITLLIILLAHEFGHYFACRFYGIDASLPYFLPMPTVIGTFGAFIRIRSAIPSRKQLFDVGVAGPLAGFAFVVPALAIGLAYSKVIPGIAVSGDLIFGTPLILRGLEAIIFPGIPSSDIYLHPVARAAWVGLLATALNLMPIGQLDGGHLVYALVGRWHKRLTLFFIVCLIPMGFLFSWTWLFWAAVLAFVARRHPKIYDESPVGWNRTKLAILAFTIFLLSFSLTPIS